MDGNPFLANLNRGISGSSLEPGRTGKNRETARKCLLPVRTFNPRIECVSTESENKTSSGMAKFKTAPDVLQTLIEGPKLPERFKALQDMGGIEGLARALYTDLRRGLSPAENSEERRSRYFGASLRT